MSESFVSPVPTGNGAMLGRVLFDEPLTRTTAVGVSLVAAGVLLVEPGGR